MSAIFFFLVCVEYDLYYSLVNFKEMLKNAKLEIFQVPHLKQLNDCRPNFLVLTACPIHMAHIL